MSGMLPIDGARRVEVATTSGKFAEYHKQRNGLIAVDNPTHRKWLRAEGLAVPANEGGATAHTPGGWVCPAGHRNFFRTCGRCGAEGERAA